MKFRLTILNVAAFFFVLSCLIYAALNYSTLSGGEGWGIIYIAGLFFFGLTAFIVDFVIRKFFKRRDHQNIAGVVALIAYILLYFFGT